jgi:hypothetical protein
MAEHDTTTSKVASGNGIFRMSAVCTSTRSRTPSRTAFSSAASGRLPDRSSLCQMSTVALGLWSGVFEFRIGAQHTAAVIATRKRFLTAPGASMP